MLPMLLVIGFLFLWSPVARALLFVRGNSHAPSFVALSLWILIPLFFLASWLPRIFVLPGWFFSPTFFGASFEVAQHIFQFVQ